MYYTIEYRDMETNQLIYSRENIPSEANHLVVYPSEEDWKALDAVGYELVDHHIEANLTVEGDNIVTFKCKKGEYTITYTGDSDATYPEGMNPTSYTYGDTIRLHNPQKTGYAFNGWKFISEGGEISGAVHDGMNTVIEATSHGNLDFEATWLELAYTVNYNAAGGTPVPAAKTDVGWNQSALLPTETPIRSGYKLVGWTYKGTMITADMKYAELAGEDTVTEEDLLAGEFTNTVTATIGEKIHRATDTTDKFEKPNSHLTLNKKTTSTPKDGVAYTLGETITYAVTAVNDGNLTLKNVTVTDELTGDTWKIETLAPGESRTFEAKYVVKEADMKNGTVKNVATATVETPNPKHPITIIVPGQTEDPIATEKVIPKDENPSKPHKNESPNTGDETDIVRWLLLTMVAAGVLLLSIVSRKRRRS